MKVNIEIDLSPQEAREMMGWPDVSKFHETVLNSLGEQLKSGGNETLMTMLQPFMAESQKAFSAYQKLMEGMVAFNAQGDSKK